MITLAESKKTTKKKPASESLTPKRKKKPETTEPKAAPAKQAEVTTTDAPERKEKPPRKPVDENSMVFNLLPYLLSFSGLFVLFCIALPDKAGFFGTVAILIRQLLSYAVWAIPLFMFFGAFKLKQDMIKGQVGQKFAFGAVCIVFISILTQLIFIINDPEAILDFSQIPEFMKNAAEYRNGGLIGGLLGSLLYKAAGTGAVFIAVFAVLIFGLFEFGCTPADILAFTKDKIRESYHDLKAKQHDKKYQPEKTEQDLAAESSTQEQAEPTKKAIYDPETGRVIRRGSVYKSSRSITKHISGKNLDIQSQEPSNTKRSIFDTISEEKEAIKKKEMEELKAQNLRDAETYIENMKDSYDDESCDELESKTIIEPIADAELLYPTNAEVTGSGGNTTEIDGVFSGGAVIGDDGISDAESDEDTEFSSSQDSDFGLEVRNGKILVESQATMEELYNYPPLDLMEKDSNLTSFEVSDEHKKTAEKLVETLANFGVRTKIINICCGPTVTRYELQPELGVRVRAIQNLSDDIALHLAAKGIRIEAPIPGKNAVGIEIPNETVSTVYIRNLIENPKFQSQKSKIAVCLGMDVAGTPVYMDIAKMPHLLIAGATGMGKSVCINSFIVSILYRARPDEVKFILIDPKKVEFSLYKGIPHLLVPVVNEPKKAAGALAWAVAEMERRFVLIEEVGVRDIAGYNAVTKNDPEKPPMSQIVIIIDELADLMMTARSEVENSICRLAQKARAAGMHIIIGTQRPSVDVITGLLKANIPSRIACTVASQVDSRTIIDIAGAEKLLGKGDMLFAPVGSTKPMRVQGAFVTESEVEAITDYLKKNFTAEYDKSIIDDIERFSAKDGEDGAQHGGSGGGMFDGDEMLIPAIEIALNAGQLSTSMLQRKLSLGYARASRIVDTLEQMNIVSGFEGSKPRRVLISEEQFLEMKMNKSQDE